MNEFVLTSLPVGSREVHSTWVDQLPRWGSIQRFRAEINFNATEVMPGDRIGNLTVATIPKLVTNRVHGFPCKCTWGNPPLNVATGQHEYPPQCSDTVTTWQADMLCVCGFYLPSVAITGDSRQRLSCGCHYGMNPEHDYARNRFGYHGAYQTRHGQGQKAA